MKLRAHLRVFGGYLCVCVGGGGGVGMEVRGLGARESFQDLTASSPAKVTPYVHCKEQS